MIRIYRVVKSTYEAYKQTQHDLVLSVTLIDSNSKYQSHY